MFSGVRPGEQPVALQMEPSPEETEDGGSATTRVNYADNVFNLSGCSNVTIDGKSVADLKQEYTESAVVILKQKFSLEYKTSGTVLTRLPWLKGIPLEEYMVDLTVQEMSRSGRFLKNKNFPYQNFFEPSPSWNSFAKGSPPKRILVLGGAGFGKTTLMTKIVYDWAMEGNSIADRFQLVIHCRLRDIRPGTNLEEHILKLCSEALGFGSEDIRPVLESVRGKTLLILDGYDEVSIQTRATVEHVLSVRSFFFASTVIVTSRPESLHTDFLACFDRHLSISSLSVKNRELLIEKVFQEKPERARSVKSYLWNNKLNFLADLSPLMLFSLCYVFDENRTEEVLSRNRFVYQVTRVMFRRAEFRERGQDSPSEDQLSNLIYRLGELFLNHLKKSILQIETTDLVNALNCDEHFLLNIGLFQRASQNELDLWEPIQKVFMDELAVRYLTQKAAILDTRCSIRNLLREHHFIHDNSVKVFVFLSHRMVTVARQGSVEEIVYVHFDGRSPYDGIFLTFETISLYFNDFWLERKYQEYTVFEELNMPSILIGILIELMVFLNMLKDLKQGKFLMAFMNRRTLQLVYRTAYNVLMPVTFREFRNNSSSYFFRSLPNYGTFRVPTTRRILREESEKFPRNWLGRISCSTLDRIREFWKR